MKEHSFDNIIDSIVANLNTTDGETLERFYNEIVDAPNVEYVQEDAVFVEQNQ